MRREGIEPPTNECQVLLDVYQDLIAANITSNPDLNFDPQIIIASADHVACRLSSSAQRSTNFWDTPRTANGSAFAEHVFDRFPDGRIAAVWSLIDRPAIEAQLRRSNKMTTRARQRRTVFRLVESATCTGMRRGTPVPGLLNLDVAIATRPTTRPQATSAIFRSRRMEGSLLLLPATVPSRERTVTQERSSYRLLR